MGIIIRQSARNLFYTYVGFGIGAVNTLFLFTYFLSEATYGVVGYVLSAANIVTPFLAFGMQNTVIKFYSAQKNDKSLSRFVLFVLVFPLVVSIPAGLMGTVGYEGISQWLSSENQEVEPYVWTIYVMALFMAYFEIFFAIAKAKLESVYGNFLKEVFHRVATMLLLFLVYVNVLSPESFIYALTASYLLRTLLMGVAVGKEIVLAVKARWELDDSIKDWVRYSAVIFLSGSVAAMLLDIDKVMLGKFAEIETIAYYNVAVYIAIVIAVPARAMHQVTYPLTATLMNQNNWAEIGVLHRKSAMSLLVISGWIFLLITTNASSMYELLPENYANGIWVVVLISMAKLADNSIGISNAIIFNSGHYRMVLFFGVVLAIITVLLNSILIPLYGIYGAALATLLAFLVYDTLKILVIWCYYRIQPYTRQTAYVLILIGILFGVFFWIEISGPFWIAILIKSVLITSIYGWLCIKSGFSEDVNRAFLTIIQKIRTL